MWYCDVELDPGATYMPFVRLALVRYQPNALPEAKISKVALAEFAQVLPRRRATFKRTAGQVAFTFRGTVPDHGPMQFTLDSEYQDISFIPGPGQLGETGRNKVELVLQTRDPNVNSDLAWGDFRVLISTIVAPAGGRVDPVIQTPIIKATEVVKKPVANIAKAARTVKGATVASTIDQRIGIGPSITLGPPTHTGNISVIGQITDIGGILEVLDPAIWQTTVTLPDVGNRPARLVVREYERYFTDHTIPEVRAGATRRRRVVEERLVYTAMFDL